MNNVEKIREQYPEGTLIELEEMSGEPQMICGLKGKVRFVDDMGQIHMRWKNGSSLALSVEEDTFNKIEQPTKLSVLLIKPNKRPKMIEIETSLEAMQEVVGGDIEEYVPFDDEVAIICNEEVKVNNLPLNRAIRDEQTNEIVDIIAGDFFIAYAPIESENFKSLPKEMAAKYTERFKYPERFSRVNDKIVVTPIKNNKDKER